MIQCKSGRPVIVIKLLNLDLLHLGLCHLVIYNVNAVFIPKSSLILMAIGEIKKTKKQASCNKLYLSQVMRPKYLGISLFKLCAIHIVTY